MTGTYTLSNTFTLTHAKYLASKVASDLMQMQLFYGRPSDEEINDYLEELITLLLGGHLDSVDYGYKKDNKWVVVVSYSAKYGSASSTDDRSGGVYPGADVSGASWGSYLRKSSSFHNLSQAEKDRIEQSLPVLRGSSSEPGFHSGAYISDKNYYNGGTSLERKVFQPY